MTTPPPGDPDPNSESTAQPGDSATPTVPSPPWKKLVAAPDVVEEPESNVPNRSDWKLMMLASTGFLILAIGLAVATGGRRNSPDLDHASTVPFIGFVICFFYGFWKLARIPDRNAREELLLGFLTILAFTPICWVALSAVSSLLPRMFMASLSLPVLFIPFILVLLIKRNTTRASARGNFASGVGLGCGALFLLSVLGIAVICGLM